MRVLLMNVTALVVLVIATVAWADDAVDVQAETLFKDGINHFKAARFKEASFAFGKANELKPNWKIQYNIGQSEAAAKRHGLALQAFEAYLSQGGDDITMERRQEVLAEVDRLKRMVGFVTVRAPDGAVVLVDGVERDTTPLPGPMMVAAGMNHKVTIVLEDEPILDRTVRVSGEQTIEIEASQAPESPPAPISQPVTPLPPKSNEAEEEPPEPDLQTTDETKGRSKLWTWGWVTSSVGVAVLIAGGITGGMTMSLNDDLNKNCAERKCLPAYWKDSDRLVLLANTTDVLLATGAGVTATGIIMLITSSVKKNEERGDTSLLPLTGPNLAGVSIQGSF